MTLARRAWATVATILALLPRLVVLAFRVGEKLFITGVMGIILLMLYDAGKFANGGWLTILGVAFAIWALAAIFKDEKEQLDADHRSRR